MSDRNINRRSVLKGISAAAMAGGMVGTASAQPTPDADDEERERLEAKYTPERVRQVVGKYATDVIRELAAEGYVERPSMNVFDLDTFHEGETLLDPTDELEGTAVTTVEEPDGLTAHIMISKVTDEYGIGLYVQPELDRAFALVEAWDGSVSDEITAGQQGAFEQDGVSTSSHADCELGYCCYHWSCSDEACDQEWCDPDDSSCTIYYYHVKKKYCPQPSGSTTIYTVGKECDYECEGCAGYAC